ncbi:MAG: hypothetical protein ACTSPR_01530 [Candidatus Thorarchaeota archaeon]
MVKMKISFIASMLAGISAFVLPMALVSYESMFLESFDTLLYFVWGIYSFRFQRIGSHGLVLVFDSQAIIVLVLVWLAISILLSVTMVYISRKAGYSVIMWIPICLALLVQVVLPILVFSKIDSPYISGRLLPLPIPSVFAILGQLLLRLESMDHPDTST